MKIKALWGFVGNAALLGAGITSPKVTRGQVFEDADDEYAHQLIGKGLVEEVVIKVDPKAKKAEEKAAAGADDNKQATPDENK